MFVLKYLKRSEMKHAKLLKCRNIYQNGVELIWDSFNDLHLITFLVSYEKTLFQ